ncbi:MAG: hypothetical protein CL931_04505 [Deltaproteobacteria bacterium]|nr:hypothetical protein [Deltaproteobacteria bacterium]
MMQRTIKRFACWASAVALSLVCLPLESEAAIIASDGGITLWISWDDLDDPGKDIDEAVTEANSMPGGYSCSPTTTGRSALGAPSSPASCPATGTCTGRDKLTGDLDNAAAYIYEATEGRHYLRRVYVSDEGRAWESADVRWNMGIGGSSAAGGGWNNPNRKMTMQSAYRTCIDDVMHHELGHYIYNLPDRYLRSADGYYRGRFGTGSIFNVAVTQRDINTVMSNNYPHLFVDTTNALIAIDYTNPATGTAVTDEVLTPGLLSDSDSTNDGPDRAHHNFTNPFAQDEWSLIPSRHVDLAGVHTEGSFPSPGAPPPVEIVFQENADDSPPPGRILVLDRSGSMSAVSNGIQAVQYVQEAGMFLYHSSDPTDFVATYLYNASVEELFPYELYDPSNDLGFASFRTASGLTDIAGALEAAIDELIATHGEIGVPGSEIYLMSDGIQTVGGSIEAQVDRAAERGIRVHTFSFGSADTETMEWISTSTGASTAPMSEQDDGAELKVVMMDTMEDLRGRTPLALRRNVDPLDLARPDPLTGTETIEANFDVPRGSRDLHFYASSPDGDVATTLQLELVDPSGAVTTSGTANNVAQLGRFAGVKVEEPDMGTWTLRLRSLGSSFPSMHVDYAVYALNLSLDVKADLDRIPGTDVFAVHATAFDRYLLSGVEATANIYLGGVWIGSTSLFDEGNNRGGDETAGDGLYSGIFSLAEPLPSSVNALLNAGRNRLRADVKFDVVAGKAAPAPASHYETGSDPAYIGQDYASNSGGNFTAWTSAFASFSTPDQSIPRITLSLPKGQPVEQNQSTSFTVDLFNARPLASDVRFSAGQGTTVNATEVAWSGGGAIGRTFQVDVTVDPGATLGPRKFALQFGEEILDESSAFDVIPAPEPSLVAMLAFGALGLSTIARSKATSRGEDRCS